MTVLCIDSGNTRLKWGLREGATWIEQGALPRSQLDRLALVVSVERLIACNVAGDHAKQVIEALAARLAVPLEWVRARAELCGVSNRYEHPEQLGADRWAALIGARGLHSGPSLVVMSGTATTVDVLDGSGVFQGGLILPGLTMMRESLAASTAELPAAAGDYRALPRNTFDAIASGCLNATLGAVERMFRAVADLPEARCLISGGAASAVSAQLAIPHQRVDNLVLEGLARIAGQK